jgi:hypothetical protein
VYNAANEVCVEAFLTGKIAFLDIVDVVAAVVDDHVPPARVTSLDDVLAADAWARGRAASLRGAALPGAAQPRAALQGTGAPWSTVEGTTGLPVSGGVA